MQTVNMHEAKTHLSRLVEKASKGESFIIARAGKPLVKGSGGGYAGASGEEPLWVLDGDDCSAGEPGRFQSNWRGGDRGDVFWRSRVKLLFDTHLLLWTCMADRLSLHRQICAESIALMDDAENELFYSAVNVWEVAIKHSQGRADFQVDPHLFRRELLDYGYAELVITGQHGAQAGALPKLHKDPFDRLLVAQAMVEGITLLTVDGTLARYGGVVRRV